MAPDDSWLTAVFERERWQLPPKPGEVERILGQVTRRRRRRLLIRSAAACLAAAAIGAASVFLVLRQGTGADEGSSLLGRPQTTGPIPEPRVVRLGSAAELATALPGATIKELDYRGASPGGGPQKAIIPQGVSESGKVIAMITPAGGSPQIVELDPATGEGRVVAKAKLPELRSASESGPTVVWTETERGTGDPENDADLAVIHRCTNRDSGGIHDLALPRHDPAGLRYERASAGISIGPGGIAVEMARAGGTGPNTSGDFDIYLAPDCGAPLRLVAARAWSAQFLGDWLYYMRDGAIWRQNVRSRTAPDRVIDKATTFQLTDDALTWTEAAAGSVMSTLYVSRPDGGHPRAFPVPETWRFAYRPNAHAVAGWIEKTRGFRSVLTGVWIYMPSRGVIVVLDRPDIALPDPVERPKAAICLGGGAAGDYMLLSECGLSVGSTVTFTDPTHEWLVKLP